MEDKNINNEDQNINQQKYVEPLTKQLENLAMAIANLGIVKACDVAKTAKETAVDLKEKASSYIDNASTEYVDKKANRDDIKTEYKLYVDIATNEYKKSMKKYNELRQGAELTINDDRCDLAQKLSEKKNLEATEIYKLYKKTENSQKRLLSDAVKRGDTETVEKCNNELKKLKEDFAKSHIGQQYTETKDNINELKKSIREARTFVKNNRKNEKGAKREFKLVKGELALDKNKSLANIEKTSKIKTLIGKISSLFKGKNHEKQPKNRNLLKGKLEAVKNTVNNFVSKVQEMQRDSFQKAASITRNGKNKIIEFGSNIKGGIKNAVITVRDAKNKKILDMKKKIVDMTDTINEKGKKIQNKESKSRENR